MIHGDDNGLILPPKIAPIQVVIVPLHFPNQDCTEVNVKAAEFYEKLKKLGLRVYLDERPNYSPFWKYNHWELKGVPIRIEIGPKDITKGHVIISRRDLRSEKLKIKFDDVISSVQSLLDDIQTSLFKKALEEREKQITTITKWEDFLPSLDAKKICLCAWCDTTLCEEDIKKRSAAENLKEKKEEEKGFRLTGAAKSLCTPFEQKEEIRSGTICFACERDAKKWTLFGRSY